MRSIKPGRGPSFMGGIVSICMGLFGLLWTVVVASSGGGIFALFGVIFIIVAVVQAVYHFTNAASPNRYSAYDITEHGEENDPLNERFGKAPDQPVQESSVSSAGSRYCPYCGAKAETGFAFCNKCGKKLP